MVAFSLMAIAAVSAALGAQAAIVRGEASALPAAVVERPSKTLARKEIESAETHKTSSKSTHIVRGEEQHVHHAHDSKASIARHEVSPTHHHVHDAMLPLARHEAPVSTLHMHETKTNTPLARHEVSLPHTPHEHDPNVPLARHETPASTLHNSTCQRSPDGSCSGMRSNNAALSSRRQNAVAATESQARHSITRKESTLYPQNDKALTSLVRGEEQKARKAPKASLTRKESPMVLVAADKQKGSLARKEKSVAPDQTPRGSLTRKEAASASVEHGQGHDHMVRHE